MIKQMPEAKAGADRRRFERVDIAAEAQVLVFAANGRKAGVLRQLACGGFMMEPEKDYSKDNKLYNFTIHNPNEDIRIHVNPRSPSAGKPITPFHFTILIP